MSDSEEYPPPPLGQNLLAQQLILYVPHHFKIKLMPLQLTKAEKSRLLGAACEKHPHDTKSEKVDGDNNDIGTGSHLSVKRQKL